LSAARAAPILAAMNAEELERHRERIERDGYTVLERVIEPELVDALHADVVRLERELAVQPGPNPFEGFKTLRIYNLLARGESFRRVPVHPTVLPLVEAVIGKGCLISSLSSIEILPGEVEQPVHADDMVFPLPRPHVPLVCNAMWAITDFTAENGATRVLPGSHREARAPGFFEDVEGMIPAEMPRGSVLIYNGSLWHRGGANRSDAPRLGIAMNYCAGWLRQQENQQLGIPLAIAREFSPQLRRLAGFGLYRRLLGHIDKCSPEDLLDETGPRRVVGEL
jgi:ectoine hydroxylase-related dioxygenase (phytanoyl-CoA dioxygenase family)